MLKSLFLCLLITISQFALADDLRDLQAEVERISKNSGINKTINLSEEEWESFSLSLGTLVQKSALPETECKDAKIEVMQKNYAMSFDKSGKFCRIYDLSFPHLGLLIGMKSKGSNQIQYTSLSSQRFQVGDFLNLIRGDYDKVLTKIEHFERMSPEEASQLQASWVTELRFKEKFKASSLVKVQRKIIPKQFLASDLDVGKFEFSKRQKILLNRMLDSLSNFSPDLVESRQEWNKIIDKPSNLLNKIQFDWNDAKKVYDIALTGQFLPINGPIALVDQSKPYRIFVEKLLRSVVQTATLSLTKLIPAPAYGIVKYTLSEAFEMINRAYTYQLNSLEVALKQQVRESDSRIPKEFVERAINLKFLDEVSIVNEYIMRLTQGKKFPWDKLEAFGRRQRYISEQGREINIARNNNQLVREEDCNSVILYSYFSRCEKQNGASIHSLLSNFSIFGYQFGPTIVYDYEYPRMVILRRSASYLLAGVAALVDLPIPGWIVSRLSQILKDYAVIGMSDEAFLQAGLSYSGDPGNKHIQETLYLQNLNPFIAKSMKHKNSIVKANKALLGL